GGEPDERRVGIDRDAVEVALLPEVVGQDERNVPRVALPPEVEDLVRRPRAGGDVRDRAEGQPGVVGGDQPAVDEDDVRGAVVAELGEEAGTGAGGAVRVDRRAGERELGEDHPGTVAAEVGARRRGHRRAGPYSA